ncbi:hypothetical protein BpHYR1_004616 [Brachionus plicatilis]|uniref:Uncharacterized protein n=1 Tax=Brachionus plicatilis TaxID=10195 RepID=A0A3M7S778_BRAPC|nr:hypothetical protein BpHYR1_004616 [Brachionus plicatilis]
MVICFKIYSKFSILNRLFEWSERYRVILLLLYYFPHIQVAVSSKIRFDRGSDKSNIFEIIKKLFKPFSWAFKNFRKSFNMLKMKFARENENKPSATTLRI